MAEREMSPTQSDSYALTKFRKANKITRKQYIFKCFVENISNIRERNELKMQVKPQKKNGSQILE